MEYNKAIGLGHKSRAAALKIEVEKLKDTVEAGQAYYKEQLANLSDQRKLREKLDALHKEQAERYKQARSAFWDFSFDHASPARQQQMARSAFFKAQNRFEGARSDEARETALRDMQSMYSRIDKERAEMPVWNGFIRSTAGAIDSNSVAAQELQERIMNDFNRDLLDNTKQQTVMMKVLKAAMLQMVKNTDSKQQGFVGGSV